MGKSLTVRIPDDLEKQLEQVSRREHISVSDLVRRSLERFLAVKRFRQLRNKILPYAQTQGFVTDQDIFKEIS